MRASDGTIGFIPLPQNLERKQTLLSLDGFYDDAIGVRRVISIRLARKKKMRRSTQFFLFFIATISCVAAEHPNILWITSEDHGPEMGCYGDKLASTPNVDALAKKGMLFKLAWSCAPLCAPARTTVITGMYPPSVGGQHMRSMVRLPDYVRFYPTFLRE